VGKKSLPSSNTAQGQERKKVIESEEKWPRKDETNLKIANL